jgi:hypothetical protein
MEYTFRNRKQIARIALVFLVFILLLAWSFKIWGVTDSEGKLSKIVVNQLKTFEYCVLPYNNSAIVEDSFQIKKLLDTGFNAVSIDFFLLLFAYFTLKYRSKLFIGKRYNLVSLCVRINE